MKMVLGLIVAVCVLLGIFFAFNNYMYEEKQADASMNATSTVEQLPVQVTPAEHATMVLTWDNTVIYVDPTNAGVLNAQMPADIVLVTDIHSDHFSSSTLSNVVGSSTILIAPQAVADLLPAPLKARVVVLKNGEKTVQEGVTIEAVPMYNIPGTSNANFHTKGRGNGYVLEKDGYRVYIAGDTAGTPEMRAMSDIDIAFVPMNLPYTMSVEEAADAVLAFKPKVVYPYHYRGQDGLSDVARFKQLVDGGNAGINVILADWYPNQ